LKKLGKRLKCFELGIVDEFLRVEKLRMGVERELKRRKKLRRRRSW